MKIKLRDIMFLGIIIQIISTQGILTFNIFKFFNFWEIKSFLHPLSFFLILVAFLLKSYRRIKITPLDWLFFLYFTATYLFVFFNVSSFLSAYLSFRDVYLLFVLVFIYNQLYLTKRQWEFLLKTLHFFIIVNILFVGLNYVLGPEKYMTLLTGRFYWDMDPDYKFKISNFFMFWRSPGIIGEVGSVAYFALLSFILMDREEKYKKKKYFALFLIAICFVRSAYLILALYVILSFIIKKKNFKKLILIAKYGLPIFLGLGIYLSKYKIFSIQSLISRLGHWMNDIKVPYNIIYGGSVGKSGAAVRGGGFEAVLDNYWLLILHAVGILGIILIFLFFYEKVRDNKSFSVLLISISIAAVFIVLTHGIPFLVLFPILFLKKNFESTT